MANTDIIRLKARAAHCRGKMAEAERRLRRARDIAVLRDAGRDWDAWHWAAVEAENDVRRLELGTCHEVGRR
ncbi:MAG: hypothetical protein ABH877_04505 [bacterium]